MKNGRKAFIETLTELAEKDPRIILIIGDVGFRFIEPYRERFPNQFINTGAAEQSMMGIAAGLARAGWKPYVYTMRNFIVFRPFEQVRNDLGFGNADVHLFGVSGSAAYSFLGHSHNVYPNKDGVDEDVAIMQMVPNMNVYEPKTEDEVKGLMLKEYNRSGPCYMVI